MSFDVDKTEDYWVEGAEYDFETGKNLLESKKYPLKFMKWEKCINGWKKIEQIIHQFVDVLLKKSIRIDQVILYGSYASGHMKLYSDIDIAIISPDFGKDKFEERLLVGPN